MLAIPEDYVIRELLYDKYGKPQTIDSMSWSENIFYDEDGKRATPYKFPDIAEEIQAEYQRLSSLEEAELKEQFNHLRTRQRAVKEQQAWFNQPEMRPIFSKWLAMPYWSLEEGVLLINNRDPSQMSIDDLVVNFSDSSIVQNIQHQEELANRYADISELDRQKNSPFSFITWAITKKLDVPSEMLIYLTEEKTKQTKIQIVKPSQKKNTSELNPKEKDSLLKLVIGMAVEQYGYNPNAARNDATANIATDLETSGIPLDRDTILKWLREASELLPNDPD